MKLLDKQNKLAKKLILEDSFSDIKTIGGVDQAFNGNKIFYKNKQVGWVLKNIYISPGHKISLKTSLEIVKNCMRNHRLPEPLYLAHEYVNRLQSQTSEPPKNTS